MFLFCFFLSHFDSQKPKLSFCDLSLYQFAGTVALICSPIVARVGCRTKTQIAYRRSLYVIAQWRNWLELTSCDAFLASPSSIVSSSFCFGCWVVLLLLLFFTWIYVMEWIHQLKKYFLWFDYVLWNVVIRIISIPSVNAVFISAIRPNIDPRRPIGPRHHLEMNLSCSHKWWLFNSMEDTETQ